MGASSPYASPLAPLELGSQHAATAVHADVRALPWRCFYSNPRAGRDPLFTKVADAWMKQIIADFGTDHAWQMDGFFGNGTGWGGTDPEDGTTATTYTKLADTDTHDPAQKAGRCSDGSCQSLGCAATTPCGLAGCAGNGTTPCDIAALEAACTANPLCTGFNSDGWLKSCVAASCGAANAVVAGIDTYVSSRPAPPPSPFPPSPPLPPDPVYLARAKGAYGAIARADGPTARWIFQGWALHVPGTRGKTPKKISKSQKKTTLTSMYESYELYPYIDFGGLW